MGEEGREIRFLNDDSEIEQVANTDNVVRIIDKFPGDGGVFNGIIKTQSRHDADDVTIVYRRMGEDFREYILDRFGPFVSKGALVLGPNNIRSRGTLNKYCEWYAEVNATAERLRI